MMIRRSVLSLFASLIALGIPNLSTSQAATSASQKLAHFHESLLERYPLVDHISTEELASLSAVEVVLFDVRKQAEYDVSHLEFANRISPKMSGDVFLKEYAHLMSGKKVIFYCSVGERSSRLAKAVMKETSDFSYDIANLEGGIFKWYNESRPLVNANGPTEKIHPFSGFWERLIIRRKLITRK